MSHAHAVQFYWHLGELIETVVGHLGGAAVRGDALVLIATPEHRAAFRPALGAAGTDLGTSADGGLVVLDADAALEAFMVDGRPDPVAFDRVIGDTVRRAGRAGRTVRAYGEMVTQLWQAGNVVGAMELEHLWNELGEDAAFSLVCGYPAGLLTDEDGPFHDLCHLHDHVIGGAPIPPEHDVARRFLQTASGPRHARQFVAAALVARGHDSVVDDAMLVVTELVTNAVIHAHSDFAVAVSIGPDVVRIAVGDTDPTPPAARAVDVGRRGGRGLRLIDHIAEAWGHHDSAGGKVVWADLPTRTVTRTD